MEFPGVFLTSFTIPTGTTTGSRIVLDGIRGAIFVYNSLNQLIASIAPNPGFDSSGNPYLAGITSQNTGQFINISQGNIFMGAVVAGVQDVSNSSQIFPSPGAGGLTLQSGKTVTRPDRSEILMLPGTNGAVTGSGTTPVLFLVDQSGVSDVDAMISGTLVKSDRSGTAATWQAPSYNSGWAGGPTSGTTHAVQFRLDPLNNLVVVGTMHTTSATPSATAFTLPVGFRTLSQWRTIVNINNGSGFAQFNTNGDVAITTNPAASGVDIHFTTTLPIGNII